MAIPKVFVIEDEIQPGYFCIVAQAEGFPATEAYEGIFRHRKDAEVVAELVEQEMIDFELDEDAGNLPVF